MQKELEDLQPQLVETAKENTKMMKVCVLFVWQLSSLSNNKGSSTVQTIVDSFLNRSLKRNQLKSRLVVNW